MTTAIQFNKTQWANIFKLTNKKDNRLKGVHFENDYMVSTDGLKAVFIFDDFSDKNNVTIDKDHNEIICNFPNMNKILELNFEDTNNQFTVNINELLQVHKDILPEAKKEEKGNNTMFMNVVQDEKAKFYDIANVISKEIIPSFRTWKYDEKKIAYNCKFMIDILNLFKSFKHKELIIKYYGTMRPISFESIDGKIKAILMPVRVY